ncbi:hypothetical protein ACFL5P_01180 [candidate division KSB1 bacterium]
MYKELDHLISEVEQFYLSHRDKLKGSFQILSSPFLFKPDYFIIGHFPEDGKLNLRNDYLQLTDDKMLNETIKTFFKRAVKTSYSYFTRADSKLLQNKNDNFNLLCEKWTVQLISMCDPKYILCNGKHIYRKVYRLLRENDIIQKHELMDCVRSQDWHPLFQNTKHCSYENNKLLLGYKYSPASKHL